MRDETGDDATPLSDLPGVDLIELSDGAVPVVRGEDSPFVVLRHATRALGLDYIAAWRMLRSRSWACVVVTTTDDRAGRRRQMVTVDVNTFVMWLATVNEHRVRATLRPRLIAWQCETRDAIADYWTRGLAVNPRGRSSLEVALLDNISAVVATVELLRSAMYWDSMTVPTATSSMPRRDLPAGVSKAQARDRALRAYRSAFWALSGPLHAVRAELPPEYQTVQPGGSIADEIAAEREQDGPPDAS